MSMTYDAIILGQGLAGTAVAWQFHWAGLRVLIIDRNESNTPSRISAGLITPITGQRLVISWQFPAFWSAALAHYRRAEAELGTSFFRETTMVRRFETAEELAIFERRRNDPEFEQITRSPPQPELDAESFLPATCDMEMLTAGQLDVPTYLQSSRDFFDRLGCYRQDSLSWSDGLILQSEGVMLPRYNVTARWLISCQGLQAQQHPWFSAVRFRPAKGEILTLDISGLTESRVVHRGIWLTRRADGLYQAGSTYEWQQLDETPTAAGREQIEQLLRQVLRRPFQIVAHHAAVRPIHLQQYPVIGRHPSSSQLGYLNGLGSKGTLQAPRLARELLAVMRGEPVFDPRCDLNRLTELSACGP